MSIGQRGVKILYLFPDTNVFIQCRPLEEFGWDKWSSSFEEVHIIVCRPVQREIDELKYRGNDRVRKRARKTHSLIGQVLSSPERYRTIRETGPRVKFLLNVSLKPSPQLKDRLDYSEVDDQIVGCLHAFGTKHPDLDARLLTYDSGPMATAQMLSLPYERVRDEWLLPPESTVEARKIKKLEREISALRSKEPQFRVSCPDDEENETTAIEIEFTRFEPLSDDDVHKLLRRLRTRFPMAQDFGSRERAKRDQNLFGIAKMQRVYTPASDEDIANYVDREYPVWLQECETRLRDLHNSLQIAEGPPEFCITAKNVGTSPGKDVFVTIAAMGKFKIRPPPWMDEDEDQNEGDDSKSIISATGTSMLPVPPAPPRGEWSSGLGRYGAVFSQFDQLQKILQSSHHMPSLVGARPPQRDPNAFYFKGGRPTIAGAAFSLTCDQWRHGIGEELFPGEIFFDLEAHEVKGALDCEIHAENLVEPVRKTIPVRIHVTGVSARESAEIVVDELIAHQSG